MNISEIMWTVIALFAAVFAVLLLADLCIWFVKRVQRILLRVKLLWHVNQLMNILVTIKPKLENEK